MKLDTEGGHARQRWLKYHGQIYGKLTHRECCDRQIGANSRYGFILCLLSRFLVCPAFHNYKINANQANLTHNLITWTIISANSNY